MKKKCENLRPGSLLLYTRLCWTSNVGFVDTEKTPLYIRRHHKRLAVIAAHLLRLRLRHGVLSRFQRGRHGGL